MTINQITQRNAKSIGMIGKDNPKALSLSPLKIVYQMKVYTCTVYSLSLSLSLMCWEMDRNN